MKIVTTLAFLAALSSSALAGAAPLTSGELIASAKETDWRRPDPDWTVYLDLDAAGLRRVVIELAPAFAPLNAGNIRALVKAHFYDGLPVYRVQDGYVVQFGMEQAPRPIPDGAAAAVKGEYVRHNLEGLSFAPLPYPDGYAPETGFANGFPAARDKKTDTAWLTHCYGAVGMSRGDDADSGGTDMYAVIGNGIRHLDRNITVFGRVILGMENLATLPRGDDGRQGAGGLGMIADPARYVPIVRARLASELPESERLKIRMLRTDTPLWQAYVESRANRHESWFASPAGFVDVCNIPVPIRLEAAGTAAKP